MQTAHITHIATAHRARRAPASRAPLQQWDAATPWRATPLPGENLLQLAARVPLALIPSGSLKPAELTAAARRVADEGKLNDPESQTWQEYADILGLAADNFDPGTRKPVIGVIEGGKDTENPQG
jgi:hypothetical protein